MCAELFVNYEFTVDNATINILLEQKNRIWIY